MPRESERVENRNRHRRASERNVTNRTLPRVTGDSASRNGPSERITAAHGNRSLRPRVNPKNVRERRTPPLQGSRTQPKLLHRAIRWSKWAVYCSNALLWPVAMAGRLEGLPERAEWLVFYWIMLVGPCVLCWDFVLKDEIEQFRRKARKRR